MSQIITSIHGREVGLDNDRRLMVPRGIVVGEHGKQVAFPSPDRVAFFEDFLGGAQAFSTTIVDGWRSRKGTTNTTDWTVTEGVNGTAKGTIGDTTASMAVSGVQLDRGLDWKANQGGLAIEARLKISTIATIAIFFGFTDQVAALEMPIQSAASADTFTTNATDAVGVMFDTSMSTDNWWLTGVANNVDATMQNSAFAPVADTYETWRIEITAAGVAVFFRNGVQIGTPLSGALTSTVALTPVFAGFNRTTSGNPTYEVDYLAVSALRA